MAGRGLPAVHEEARQALGAEARVILLIGDVLGQLAVVVAGRPCAVGGTAAIRGVGELAGPGEVFGEITRFGSQGRIHGQRRQVVVGAKAVGGIEDLPLDLIA